MSFYVIAEPCVGVKDGACVEVCPVACIHTTPDAPQHYIDPDICIACEQCEIVCPVHAIFLDSNLPPEWEHYIDINAAFFRQNKAVPKAVAFDKAVEMVRAVHGYAARAGIAVTAVVTDEGGRPIALGRMDGADPLTAELALNKAYTASNFQVPTNELVPEAHKPWFRSLVVHSGGRIMAAAGALPIIDGPFVLGAIAVHGSPRPDQDTQCCRVGMAALEGTGH